MTTPNPLAKTKGAGTTLWMYTGNGDAFANPLSDTDWLRLAMVKDLQPGEMTADAEDDTYLDDEDADWKTTTQGQKSVGDTSATLAWRPGDSGQKNWFSCSIPVKSARFVSNTPTVRLMFSVAG
ncbi:major tail protein V [Shigella flexneri 2850-71]|nr:major tail protein V [Shigella flexneri 2850-71]